MVLNAVLLYKTTRRTAVHLTMPLETRWCRRSPAPAANTICLFWGLLKRDVTGQPRSRKSQSHHITLRKVSILVSSGKNFHDQGRTSGRLKEKTPVSHESRTRNRKLDQHELKLNQQNPKLPVTIHNRLESEPSGRRSATHWTPQVVALANCRHGVVWRRNSATTTHPPRLPSLSTKEDQMRSTFTLLRPVSEIKPIMYAKYS